MSVPVRCHHCGCVWIGESSRPLTFVGMFQNTRDSALVTPPRETHRCKSCGWINVFKPAAQDYRDVELKRAS